MAEASDQMGDRRYGARRRTFLGGVLVHGDSLTTPCATRDISSDSGAQIRLRTVAYLSRPTLLLAPSLNRGWEIAVIWQSGLTVGVSFVREFDLRAPRTEIERTAQRIWRARGGR